MKNTLITIRLDEELKKKMNEMKWIRWSEVIREAIKKKLEEEKRKNIAYAVKLHLELLSKQKKTNEDSTELLRKFRDERK